MRILIIGLLISISFPAFAQEKETTKTVSQETQVILERVDAAGEWVSGALDKLANTMGTTVEYLWPIYVKKVIVIGFIQIAVGIIFLIIGLTSFYFFLNKSNKYEKLNDNNHAFNEESINCEIAGYIILLVSVVTLIAFVACGIINIVTPEPDALYNITSAIDRLK